MNATCSSPLAEANGNTTLCESVIPAQCCIAVGFNRRKSNGLVASARKGWERFSLVHSTRPQRSGAAYSPTPKGMRQNEFELEQEFEFGIPELNKTPWWDSTSTSVPTFVETPPPAEDIDSASVESMFRNVRITVII